MYVSCKRAWSGETSGYQCLPVRGAGCSRGFCDSRGLEPALGQRNLGLRGMRGKWEVSPNLSSFL